MMVRSQSTTCPSASPEARRWLFLTKAVACTCAWCPRRTDLGVAGSDCDAMAGEDSRTLTAGTFGQVICAPAGCAPVLQVLPFQLGLAHGIPRDHTKQRPAVTVWQPELNCWLAMGAEDEEALRCLKSSVVPACCAQVCCSSFSYDTIQVKGRGCFHRRVGYGR